jgi:hypothetical protein
MTDPVTSLNAALEVLKPELAAVVGVERFWPRSRPRPTCSTRPAAVPQAANGFFQRSPENRMKSASVE